MIAARRLVPGRRARRRHPASGTRRLDRLRLGMCFLAVCSATLTILASGSPAGADPLPHPVPTTSSPALPGVTPTPSPCAPYDCIPQPSAIVPTDGASPSDTLPPDLTPGGGPGGITGWVTKGISAAITTFFRTIVTAALNPLISLLSDTLLTTPSLSSLPRVGELWANSWLIALACYGILIALAGIVLMSYESLQASYSLKEIAPRIPVGLLSAGLSLFLAGKAVDLANALSHAVMGDDVNGDTAGTALRNFVVGSFAVSGDLFIDIMWVVVIGVLVALLLTYVVRVALTVILVAGAPLALMCHALPQTEAVARWWWKAFGGVLAVQVAQSLTLIAGVRVFLTPDGFARQGLFGGAKSGLVDLLITLALMYILFKIPFWILGSIRIGGGRRSFAGSALRAYAMYRTMGLLRGTGGVTAGRRSPAGSGSMSRARATTARIRTPSPTRPPVQATSVPRRTSGSMGRPPLGPPLFLEPRAPDGSASRPVRPATVPPTMPTFRAPGLPSAPSADPSTLPTRPPGPPLFLAPRRSQPDTAADLVPSIAREPAIRQSAPAPTARARRASEPPPQVTFSSSPSTLQAAPAPRPAPPPSPPPLPRSPHPNESRPRPMANPPRRNRTPSPGGDHR